MNNVSLAQSLCRENLISKLSSVGMCELCLPKGVYKNILCQKPVGVWSSRDHMTSAVIYDKEQDSYVGIFNNNTIKMRKEDVADLDKVKKHKFPINMLKLMPRTGQAPLIIFSNGNCASLSYVIENRKTYESKFLLKESEYFRCCLINR